MATTQRTDVLGIEVDNLSTEEFLERVQSYVDEGRPRQIVYANIHTHNLCTGDPAYRRIVRGADLVYPDGMGVVLASHLVSTPLKERVNAGDFLPDFCRMAVERGYRIYILGGEDGIAERARDVLMGQHPGLEVVGTHSGYFDGSETPRIVSGIREAKPDVLFVGMGSPLQEVWIRSNLEALEVPVAWGVGALFDYYAGTTPRAPVWMRKTGLEWLHRLAMEPGRMWRRYLVGNVVFASRVVVRLITDVLSACAGVNVEVVDSLPVVETKAAGLSPGQRFAKRTMDIVLAMVLGMLLAALYPFIYLAIKLASTGSVLFQHERIGLNGKPFTMYKFRTMHESADEYEEAPVRSDDDRVIPVVGRILRRFSLDELPQVFNVLKGEMSMVGPRPEMPFLVDRYRGWHRMRLSAKPGITGLWQIIGRKDLPLYSNLEYDFYYIQNQSLMFDLLILIKTIPCVLLGKGAY